MVYYSTIFRAAQDGNWLPRRENRSAQSKGLLQNALSF